MLIQIISDVHCEFHLDRGKSFLKNVPVVGDVLVVAGDLAIEKLLVRSLTKLCDRFPEVLFVAGNHEFYGSSFTAVEDILRDIEARISNLTWLNNKRVVINGQGFLGDTLWYPDYPDKQRYKTMLADFRLIRNFEPEVYNRYEGTYKFLEKYTMPGDVVVTHHTPSEECISEQYKNSPINCWFASPCEEIIVEKQPAVWISGHTHDSYNFMLDKTQLVCNPYGYVHETNECRGHFKKDLVIEV